MSLHIIETYIIIGPNESTHYRDVHIGPTVLVLITFSPSIHSLDDV